ncbi:carboxy terminal-processing peptidase [Paraferrimonas sp. SM1919]|uniref:carboxy terminal-processing peptidase n=1 Tax=Paraferrimonas sp. SM1919 TaxID=2662263 RepID=UPI0013D5F1EC|nr:carboxy terminal-processing peptidase [Paraferrimonas sp. SM1919]
MKKTLALALALLISSSLTWAIEPKLSIDELPVLTQEEQHATSASRITVKFRRSHYHRFSFDDSFSEQVKDRFIKQLDFNKTILTASDIARLEPYKYQFDDMLRSGKLQPAYDFYNYVAQKRYQRLAYALKLLEQPMNFDLKGDVYQFDRENSEYAKTEAELDELWRQRIKNEALNLTLTGKSWEEVKELLGKRYNNAIKRLTQTNSEDVFQSLMNAFARTIEPHTSYLSPRNAERFKQQMSLSLEGIGASLFMRDDYTVIRSLVPGGPAEKSDQLAPDDRIIGIKQEDEKEFTDVIGWRLDDVVDLIKGPKGTVVTLEILPKKGGAKAQSFELAIVRDKIRLVDSAAKGKIIQPKAGIYKDLKVGVIEIPSFYHKLSEDIAKELANFEGQDIAGVVLDLRSNGGGDLREAINVTGLFIDQGPVVQVRDSNERILQHRDNSGSSAYDGPLTVLVDRYSASASEILAAALQDYGRALIVGEDTFGKGTVQRHMNLTVQTDQWFKSFVKPIGSVQYTMAKFYRINGGSTQLKGVTPDIKLPSPFEPGEFGEADEDNPLPWDKIPESRFSRVDDVNLQLIESLLPNHQTRMQQSKEIGYILDDIARYKENKAEKAVSLELSIRQQEQQQDDALALKRLNERLQAKGLDPVKDLESAPEDFEADDAYLDEAINLTIEMANSQLYAKK